MNTLTKWSLVLLVAIVTLINVAFGMKPTEGASSSSAAGDSCSICQELLTADGSDYQLPRGLRLAHGIPNVITTTCGHTFHTRCILSWIVNAFGGFNAGRLCPLCNNNVAMQGLYDRCVVRPTLLARASSRLTEEAKERMRICLKSACWSLALCVMLFPILYFLFIYPRSLFV